MQLAYWGRWNDGRWWAYLWWWAAADPSRPAEAAMAGERILCCGWSWSRSVRAMPEVSYTQVPRVELPTAPDDWPDPARDWATTIGRPVRHQGLMGHPLGPPVDEAPTDGPPPRRKQAGASQTLAERAQARRH